jgi:hypothetical protein
MRTIKDLRSDQRYHFFLFYMLIRDPNVIHFNAFIENNDELFIEYFHTVYA